jgi:hypothetical protein
MGLRRWNADLQRVEWQLKTAVSSDRVYLQVRLGGALAVLAGQVKTHAIPLWEALSKTFDLGITEKQWVVTRSSWGDQYARTQDLVDFLHPEKATRPLDAYTSLVPRNDEDHVYWFISADRRYQKFASQALMIQRRFRDLRKRKDPSWKEDHSYFVSLVTSFGLSVGEFNKLSRIKVQVLTETVPHSTRLKKQWVTPTSDPSSTERFDIRSWLRMTNWR